MRSLLHRQGQCRSPVAAQMRPYPGDLADVRACGRMPEQCSSHEAPLEIGDPDPQGTALPFFACGGQDERDLDQRLPIAFFEDMSIVIEELLDPPCPPRPARDRLKND